MRVLSIDPGYERVGIAVLEDGNPHKLIYSECLKTKSSLLFNQRLLEIGKGIEKVIKEYKPESMAVEKLFFTTNQKTVMGVSEARGVVIYEGAKAGLKIYEYTPLQIKIATTGYGKAPKDQVNLMVRQLIKIEKEIKHDDEMDAIAVGLTCLACYRSEV